MVAHLIDRLGSAAQADPSMHVYHYAAYEGTALKNLTGRYGVREARRPGTHAGGLAAGERARPTRGVRTRHEARHPRPGSIRIVTAGRS
jgi:hypothetical protein